MEPPPWTSPFPPLSLAPDEKNQLIRTAESLIDDVLESYPEFLYESQQPQPSLWSPVKTREDVTVYKSKRQGGGTPNRNVQLLLVVGSVHGTFNDVAYGMLSHTTEAVRIRSAYTQDLLFHGVVLDTVLSPTQEYPFRSMTVRWCAKGLPLYVRAVSKTPDAVLLSATGTRTLATGEVIGFDLVQSVSFSSTPPLPQYDRTSISRCTLWRQISPDRVQVVTRVLWLLEDCLVESAVVKSYADTYVAVGNVTLCAHRKKLVWLVENRKYVRLDYQGRDNAGSCCVVCGDPLSSTRLTLKHACAVCTKPTCSKCRIKHDLAYVEPDGQVSHRRTRFCVTCIGYANRLDGEMIAKEEAPSSRPSSTTESVTTT